MKLAVMWSYYFVAMYLIKYHVPRRDAERRPRGGNYQHNTPSATMRRGLLSTAFRSFSRKPKYKSPAPGGLDGPFQDAHKTQLPFFE